ncbi:MAG TPA: thioredoxin family protein [bacterium]|nr:thioredoxin family protein [bacterium]
MKIEVIGSGCPTCKKMYEATIKVVADLGLEAEVAYSTDITKIIEMGVMQSPVLAVDGEALIVGAADQARIKQILEKVGK